MMITNFDVWLSVIFYHTLSLPLCFCTLITSQVIWFSRLENILELSVYNQISQKERNTLTLYLNIAENGEMTNKNKIEFQDFFSLSTLPATNLAGENDFFHRTV